MLSLTHSVDRSLTFSSPSTRGSVQAAAAAAVPNTNVRRFIFSPSEAFPAILSQTARSGTHDSSHIAHMVDRTTQVRLAWVGV